ncbi:MAG: beta-ketoacyl-ACP synthase [Succinatimonas sp.]|nr:beta-ketoacyl-ACP synthase [Succinatimonas sp.]MCI7025618.1 beta-ketoacyl-ACP synthase [Succinatimonas sp.]MDD6756333.1 beta-ketoacyl-ACP synthase [Succinatimonas sp.]
MIYINDLTSVSSLGTNELTIVDSLSHTDRCYLTYRDDLLNEHKGSYFGQIKAKLPRLDEYPEHKSRNSAVLAFFTDSIKDSINELKQKYSKDRIAIILGTSTSGLDETENELKKFMQTGVPSRDFYYKSQEFGDPSMFLADYLEIDGPAYTISTACSSSARALICGKRMLESGLVDAVIAGGADTLCKVPINGFNSMGVISQERCLPFNKNRAGINIGEGGGLMILSKEKASLELLGVGESSDAYHVSSPDPSGAGAISAMEMALNDASLTTDDIGYVNLHGTATKLNDAMESKAMASLFKGKVPCSSTKYMTGHTLGAAGIVEAAILCYLLKHDLDLPVQDFSHDEIDDTLDECGLIKEKIKAKKKVMMSNSFAFGGNNASIIIAKA